MWEQPYKMKIAGTEADGVFCGTKEASKPVLKLEGSFNNFPPGTKIKVGEEDHTYSGFFTVQLDLKPAIRKSTLDELRGRVELDVPIQIDAGGLTVATKLPKQDIKESLRFALARARDGGLRFGPDDVPAAKVRSIAVVAGYSDLDFVGSGTAVTDVDQVAIAEDQPQPRKSKVCNFSKGAATLKIHDSTVTLIDRRTGEKLRSTVLKGSEDCPMFAMVSKDDNSAKATVPARDVTAWARRELK